MSHPRPPAQPFSCLPSRCRQPAALLSVGTPQKSSGGAQPVPGILPRRGRLGELGEQLPSLGAPLHSSSLRPSLPHPDQRMLQPGHPSALPAPSLGPAEPELGPPAQTRSGAALASLPATAPSHERLGPRGAFREVPAPAHTHVRTAGARRTTGRGLKRGGGCLRCPGRLRQGRMQPPAGGRPPSPPHLCPSIPTSSALGVPAAGETEARGGGSPPGVPAVGGASASPSRVP